MRCSRAATAPAAVRSRATALPLRAHCSRWTGIVNAIELDHRARGRRLPGDRGVGVALAGRSGARPHLAAAGILRPRADPR